MRRSAVADGYGMVSFEAHLVFRTNNWSCGAAWVAAIQNAGMRGGGAMVRCLRIQNRIAKQKNTSVIASATMNIPRLFWPAIIIAVWMLQQEVAHSEIVRDLPPTLATAMHL